MKDQDLTESENEEDESVGYFKFKEVFKSAMKGLDVTFPVSLQKLKQDHKRRIGKSKTLLSRHDSM